VLRGLFEALYLSLNAPQRPSQDFVQGLAQAMASHLVRHYESARQGRTAIRGGLPAHKLHRIIDAMRANLAEPFELAFYADMAGLSVFHFSRVFKQATGVTPSAYRAGGRAGG
jgi:AraC family transcriptional regulator